MATPIRVLLADDVVDIRRLLRTMLELDGFEVVADVGTGTEVLDLLTSGVHPDVIVVDERMPDFGGVETARRARDLRPEQLVLLYTAFPHLQLERAAKEAGVSAVLGKTDGIEQLEREIVRCCDGR